ncbi:MAG: Rossmann-like and DUF2520 domain-containing protein [Acidobacteriota bacterium]
MGSRRFAILGAGRMGRALGRLLALQGLQVGGVTARTLRSARRAVRFIGAGQAEKSNRRAASGASLIFIATPDRTIPPLARELARTGPRWDRKVVAHTSGAMSSSVLEPLRRRGARVASLHPLASIADPRTGLSDVARTPFAIEGDPEAVRLLRRLVARAGGIPVTIPRQAKTLYHLIAVLLSNDLVALLSFGLEAARALGLSEREAIRLYMPLVRGTVDNVARLGPVRALTGPVSRGDATTLRLHAHALRTVPADFRRLHRLLAQRSTALALKAKTITPEIALRLDRLLGSLP